MYYVLTLISGLKYVKELKFFLSYLNCKYTFSLESFVFLLAIHIEKKEKEK